MLLTEEGLPRVQHPLDERMHREGLVVNQLLLCVALGWLNRPTAGLLTTKKGFLKLIVFSCSTLHPVQENSSTKLSWICCLDQLSSARTRPTRTLPHAVLL